jgi:hypothetical protein
MLTDVIAETGFPAPLKRHPLFGAARSAEAACTALASQNKRAIGLFASGREREEQLYQLWQVKHIGLRWLSVDVDGCCNLVL